MDDGGNVGSISGGWVDVKVEVEMVMVSWECGYLFFEWEVDEYV